MVEQQQAEKADSKSENSKAKPPEESLFVRSNTTPVHQDATKDSSKPGTSETTGKQLDSKSKETDGTSSDKKTSGESLFSSVMADIRSFKQMGSTSVSTLEAAVDKGLHKDKVDNADKTAMLGGFLLVENVGNAKAEKSVDSSGKGSELREDAKAKEVLTTLKADAYNDKTAAYVTVANELADHPRLKDMVTDDAGNINLESVNHALKIDASAQVMAKKHDLPGPQELSSEERKALTDVRTHFTDASNLTTALAIGSATGGITGSISALALAGMDTKSLAKTLDSMGDSLAKGDLGDVASKLIKAAQDSVSSISKIGNDATNGQKQASGSEAGSKAGDSLRGTAAANGVEAGAAVAGAAAGAAFGRYVAEKGNVAGSAADNTAGTTQLDRSAAPDQSQKDSRQGDNQLRAGSPQDQPAAPPKPGDMAAPLPADKPTPREEVGQLTDDQFGPVAKSVLGKIDTNHTGQITKDQLIKAMEDPQFKGQEAQALAAMYHSFDSLHNLSGHEGVFSTKSITAADVDKYAEIQKDQSARASDAYAMKNWAHTNLGKFDKDNSGSLTKDEIGKAISDPKTSAEDKQMLQTIQKHYSEMGHMWESGVNLKAFDDFASNIYKDSSNAKMVAEVWGAAYGTNLGQHTDISHDLYGDTKNPLNSINAEGIHQGTIGDCYYVSSLAAVAQAHPEVIKNAIKDNGNGTYTVTFPGDKDHPVTIKAPTEAEQGLYNRGSANGLWASVMEKAYGAYCQESIFRRGPFNMGGGNVPEEGADGGGRTAGAMKLLTGSDISTNTTTFTFQSTMAENLTKAFSSHPAKAVTAGINGNLPLTSEQTADKFYKGHAYTITNFVPDGHGDGMVTIRNPWGKGQNTTDGTITVPLSKFMSNFSDVSIEQ